MLGSAPSFPQEITVPLSLRTTAATAAVGLVAAGLAVAGSSTAPVGAAEATTDITFRDCEVRKNPFQENQRVADDLTWPTTLRMNHPSPIPANQDVTAEIELGPLPVGFVPQDMKNVELYVDLYLANGITSPLRMLRSGIVVGDLDASQPLPIEEVEVTTGWFGSGLYPQRPTDVLMYVTGTDTSDVALEYSIECDNQVNPPSLLNVAVYDLAATPAITLSTDRARQGQRVTVSGTDLLTAAPTSPAAQVTVTVGGTVVGRFPVGQSGAFAGTVVVPPFARPGTVQVRVSNGGKAATAPLTVSAVGATVKASPKAVKRGGKVKLTGAGYKPGEKVTLRLSGGKGQGKRAYSVSATANGSGAIATSVKLKQAAKGTWRVAASGTSSSRKGRTSFRVR